MIKRVVKGNLKKKAVVVNSVDVPVSNVIGDPVSPTWDSWFLIEAGGNNYLVNSHAVDGEEGALWILADSGAIEHLLLDTDQVLSEFEQETGTVSGATDYTDKFYEWAKQKYSGRFFGDKFYKDLGRVEKVSPVNIDWEEYRTYQKKPIRKAYSDDLSLAIFDLAKQIAREVFQSGPVNLDPSDTNALWDFADQYWPDVAKDMRIDFQSGFANEMRRLLEENKTSSKKADYNGYSNWETWNAYTQMTSYEESYQLALQANSAEDLQRMFPDIRRLVEQNYSSDLTEEEIWGDISQINWQELYQAVKGELTSSAGKTVKTYLKNKPVKKAQEETVTLPEGEIPDTETQSKTDFFNFLDQLKQSGDNLSADAIIQKLVDAFGISSEEATKILEEYENQEETQEEQAKVDLKTKKAQTDDEIREHGFRAGRLAAGQAIDRETYEGEDMLYYYEQLAEWWFRVSSCPDDKKDVFMAGFKDGWDDVAQMAKAEQLQKDDERKLAEEKKAQIIPVIEKAVKAGLIKMDEKDAKIEEFMALNDTVLKTAFEIIERSISKKVSKPVIALGKLEPEEANEYSKLFESKKRR
jgi:hypothetical protein